MLAITNTVATVGEDQDIQEPEEGSQLTLSCRSSESESELHAADDCGAAGLQSPDLEVDGVTTLSSCNQGTHD